MRRPAFRPSILPAVALVLGAALPAHAGQVYQWKDAKGVTHYSDFPPPGQKATQRNLDPRAPAAPSKPVVNADCSNARSNLAILKGTGPVGLDANRDGKHERELTPAERAERTAKAEQAVKTYCEGGPVTPSR
ncbi:DUF4124 domain-containing protein [Lysobacter olei]